MFPAAGMSYLHSKYFLLWLLGITLSICSCVTDKYCSDYYTCEKRFRITVDAKADSVEPWVQLAITNRTNVRLKLYDSITVLYYRYNQNLRTPNHDSLYGAQNAIVDFVELSGQVSVKNITLDKNFFIGPDSSFIIKLSKDDLQNTVLKTGNADNQFQLKNGFQLFVVSTTRKHKKVHLASEAFIL